MDGQLGTRAMVLFVLGIIGFVLAFIGVFANFFFSGVAIVLAILSGVFLLAALITSTALVVFRSLVTAADADDPAEAATQQEVVSAILTPAKP